jgi:hypothetical protein
VKTLPDFIVTSGVNPDGSSNGVNVSVWKLTLVQGDKPKMDAGVPYTPYKRRYVKIMGCGAGDLGPHKYNAIKDIMIGSF